MQRVGVDKLGSRRASRVDAYRAPPDPPVSLAASGREFGSEGQHESSGEAVGTIGSPGDAPRAAPALMAHAVARSVKMWFYATERGSRPLIGVAGTVSQSTPPCSSRRSR